jgi:hypothetical protein
MVAPIDYSITGIPDPREEFVKSYQLSEGLKADQVAKQQAAMHSQALSAAMQKAMSPDATAADYRNLSLVSSQGKEAKDLIAGLTDEQNQAALSALSETWSALDSGNPDIINSVFDRHIAANENSGNKQGADVARAMKMLAQTDPSAAKAANIRLLAATKGGDTVIDKWYAAQKAPAEIGEKEAQAKEAAARTAKTQEETKWIGPKNLAEINKINAEAAKALKEETGGKVSVQKSEVYKNGTAMMIGSDGQNYVQKPGKPLVLVASEEGAKYMEEAVKSGPIYAAGVAGATTAATEEEKNKSAILKTAMTRAGDINESVAVIDDAIKFVKDKKPISGFVEKYLPNISDKAIGLQQIITSMGLEVIRLGKFGQLNKGELELALRTGLPPGLSPEGIVEHLERKKAAQLKLQKAIASEAIKISEIGLAQYMKENYVGEGTPTPPPSGGTGAAPAAKGSKLAGGMFEVID